MTGEQVRAPERPSSERCPYCHDEIAAATDESADARVVCAGCGAPHHAQCFIENRHCAATACRSTDARVAGADVPLPVGVLAAEVSRGTVASGGPGRTGLVPMLIFVAASLVVVGLAAGGVVLGLALFLIGVLAVVILLLLLAPDLPEARVAEEGEPIVEVENPVVGQVGGPWFGGDPYEAVKQRIEAEERESPEPEPPRAASVAAPVPGTCPACGRSLEKDAEGEDLRFCYHCGAALA